MNEQLKLARTHCHELLGENLILANNNDFLIKLLELMRQTSVLEGHDYGIIPFDTEMPSELMQDALDKVGKRFKELIPKKPGAISPPPKKMSRAERKRLREIPNATATG